ncbi:Fumarylacetoacetase [Fusarium duplospermum]|uniref:Fumarylacetoacetase n=1 Tax=Fusarium duplospermum TaxID=1325734 RepID=A0A428P0W2_9HYPO|nr:Fumarylacetoacetase [Fusarium duplospermum]
MHLPMAIGDYTDFYAGRNHAFNVGVLFRGAANALNPNYNHLPVGYHGRASSVVVSGTPLRRPWGQVLAAPGDKTPVFRPSSRLDIELELGMFICQGNTLGEPIPVNEAENYIFGYVLVNDWSARDVQAWEYVPLGPFNSKNLGTTISPWVVLADALDPFKAKGLHNDVGVIEYLREKREDNVVDIHLEVTLKTPKGTDAVITRTSSTNLLWSWPQMIAHHTITGCNLRPGDFLASGTISGTEDGTQGSFLEQTRGGKSPLRIGTDGEERKFLEDGDTVIIRGWAGTNEDELVGFGDCAGQILEVLPPGQ